MIARGEQTEFLVRVEDGRWTVVTFPWLYGVHHGSSGGAGGGTSGHRLVARRRRVSLRSPDL